MKAKTIKIYTGKTIENKCGKQLHPISEVENAIKLLKETENIEVYSNSTDFCMAMKYCRPDECSFQIFLNGKEVDMERVFNEFNKSYDLINKKSNPKFNYE